MAILEIEGLAKDFKGLRALNNVDIKIQQGEIFGLIGPNGSGKSTMINVITGFLKPTAGKITYKGELIGGLMPHQIAKKGVIRTFQLTSIFPDLTVEQNIIRGKHLNANSSILGSSFWTKGYRREEAKLKQEAIEMLALVNIQGKSKMVARNLPPAERKILDMAIAMAAKPTLLLLDEPASGMNAEEAVRVVELIRSLHQTGITIVIVEHNMKVIMDLCFRIVVLNYGIKIAEGTPEEVANNQDVISIYLGKRRENNA
jgi:branched-chain amino acid transport system ATP-binding protein